MKANKNTPNTLFLSLWTQNKHSVVLAKLRNHNGEIESVAQDYGNDVYTLLAAHLADLQIVKAGHILIYTNDRQILGTYRFPIRLEPTTEQRQHLYNPHQWRIIRCLCGYLSWQLIEMKALPNAQALWREQYGRS